MFKKLKRATFAVALFVGSLGSSVQKNKEISIPLKNIINEAQSYLLMKDRGQAVKIIAQAIKNEKSHSKNHQELIKILKKSSEIFFSEKAQQTYELALATFSTDKNQTKEKLLESLKMEPQNGLILKGLIFTFLSLKDCVRAKTYLDELKLINEFDDELERLKMLASICAKNKSEALAIITKMDPQILSHTFWIVNKQRIFQGEGSEIPISNKSLEGDYPELLYTYWMQEKNPKKKVLFADKYKQLCQSPPNYDKSYSFLDPWVCEHFKEFNN